MHVRVPSNLKELAYLTEKDTNDPTNEISAGAFQVEVGESFEAELIVCHVAGAQSASAKPQWAKLLRQQ